MKRIAVCICVLVIFCLARAQYSFCIEATQRAHEGHRATERATTVAQRNISEQGPDIERLRMIEAEQAKLEGDAIPQDLDIVEVTRNSLANYVTGILPNTDKDTIDLIEKDLFETDKQPTIQIKSNNYKTVLVLVRNKSTVRGASFRLNDLNYAIMPISVLSGAIRPNGVNPGDLKRWYEGIAMSLAAKGTCRALAVYNNGNAKEVTIRLKQNAVDMEIISDEFKKKGTYDVSDFRPVIYNAERFTLREIKRGSKRLIPIFW